MKQIAPRAMAAPFTLFALFSLALPCTANASNEDSTINEINKLRSEFEQKLEILKRDYEARLLALETKTPKEALPPAQARPPAADNFNPEISLVLQGAFVRQKDQAQRPVTGSIPGFLMPAEETPVRGFSLGGTELLMSADVAPHLRGHVNFSLTDDSVEVEEAWVQKEAEDKPFQLKGGRFLSGISHANEQHPHTRDFYDTSLMQRILFGEHLVQDGVQLKWLSPSEIRLEAGIEMARGQAFPGSTDAGNRNGFGSWAGFARTGGNIGSAQNWHAGLSGDVSENGK